MSALAAYALIVGAQTLAICIAINRAGKRIASSIDEPMAVIHEHAPPKGPWDR